jgi:hypothetical protein
MSFVKKIIIENSCMRDKVYSWDCSFQAVFLATDLVIVMESKSNRLLQKKLVNCFLFE